MENNGVVPTTSDGLVRERRPLGLLTSRLNRDRIAGSEQAHAILRTVTIDVIASAFNSATHDLSKQIRLAHAIEESDDHIRGTLQLRRTAVTRLQLSVEPGDPTDPRSVQAAEIAATFLEQPWFIRASDWLLGAVLKQWAAVEVFWTVKDGLWCPNGFRSVEPSRITWDRDENAIALYRDLTRKSETIRPAAGQFMVHSFDANSSPGDFAMVRAIAALWYLSRTCIAQWGTQIDMFGVPTTVVIYETGQGKESVEERLSAMLELAAKRIIAVPQGTDVKLEPVPDSLPHEQFQTWYRRLVSRLLVGQDSSQMAIEGQQTGATIQGDVRNDIRDMDAMMLDASQNETLMVPWCLWNFGPDVAAPKIKRITQDSPDAEAQSRVFTAAQGLGLTLKTDQVYRDLGIERPEGIPDIITPPAPVAPSFPGFGAFRRSKGGWVANSIRDELRSDTALEDAARRDAEIVERNHIPAIVALMDEIDAEGGSDEVKASRFRERLPGLIEKLADADDGELLAEAITASMLRGRRATEIQIERGRK